MTIEELREKTKEFVVEVLQESKQFDKTHDDRIKSRTVAFGAVWFVQSIEHSDELMKWWNDLMHPQFTERGVL